jgi:hypothetical protein
MIEIKPVITKKDIKAFAKYPLELYKDCPYYVPNILADELTIFDKKKNLSLDGNEIKGFLAYKNNELVGRIAAIINDNENSKGEEKYIRFSRFECIDDIEVFKALLGAVEKLGKERGLNIIHGPWGFTDQDREGLLTYGFDKRSTYVTNYYYEYFHKNLTELGFEDESKWIEFNFEIPKEPIERFVSFAERVKKKYNFRDIAEELSLREIIKDYGFKLFDTLDEAYGHLDGYVPLSEKMRKNLLSQFGLIINKRYISILVDENDEVAAFGICFPSICNAMIKSRGKLFPLAFIDVLKSVRKPKELEMALIGVKKKYKNLGLNSLVITRIVANIIEDGIEVIESNPMLETNLAIQQQWKFVNTEVIKKRQTYKKEIGSLIK